MKYMITRVLYRDFAAAARNYLGADYDKACHGATIEMYIKKGGAKVKVHICPFGDNPYYNKTIRILTYDVDKLMNDGQIYSGLIINNKAPEVIESWDSFGWMTKYDEKPMASYKFEYNRRCNINEAKRLLAKYEPDLDLLDFVAEFYAEETIAKYKELEERETVPAGACAPACCSSTPTAVSSPSSVPADSSPIDAAVPAVVPVKSRALRSRRASRTTGTSPRRLTPCTTVATAQRKSLRYQLPRARPCGSTSIAAHRLGAARFYPAIPTDLFL